VLHDGVGRNLAELIYDGIGNDRPDLKNSRPLVYNEATRRAHTNHVHAAVYDGGGLLPPGLTFAYNGTGRNEQVLTAGRAAPAVNVRVFIGDRELTDIVRVETDGRVAHAFTALSDRMAYNG